jgi:tetratricopeptide (TPR) repeat protein
MKRALRACLICCLLASPTGEPGAAQPEGPGPSTRGDAQTERRPAGFNDYGPFLAARMKIARCKYRDALEDLNRITTNTPDDEALKLILLGQCYEGLPDITRAFAAYEKAEAVAPPGAAAILRKGILHRKRGDLDKARELLARYVQLEPGNPEACYHLFLCEQHDAKKKAALAKQLVELDGPDGNWSAELLKAEW